MTPLLESFLSVDPLVQESGEWSLGRMCWMERLVTVKRLSEPDEPWRYWRTRPMAERLAMVEQLRREHHGWTNGTGPRLQRVHCVLRRS